MRFHPQRWAKVYDHWMGNIKDWCISRQLWWGHRIPVWYSKPGKSEIRNPKSEIYVGVEPPSDPENWEQDPDVLDTWFSSWLWPFATMGWPEQTPHPEGVLSDHRPCHRAGHHFLLGRAHDHGGLRVHGGFAVPECLFHRHHPRQAGTQDVQEPRQFARPARSHRQIRRRRAPVRHHAQRAARPGHFVRRTERRAGPQFLQQALERLPFPADGRTGFQPVSN